MRKTLFKNRDKKYTAIEVSLYENYIYILNMLRVE